MSRTYSLNNYQNQYRNHTAKHHSAAHTIRIRKAVQKKSRSRFMFIAVLCLSAGILIGMLFAPAQTSEASMSYDVKTRYTSICVEEGMTLTSIAKEYNTEKKLSNRDYVKEVQRLNGVYDNKIRTGSWLTIPYYERVMHEGM